jgi:hypothetical protein
MVFKGCAGALVLLMLAPVGAFVPVSFGVQKKVRFLWSYEAMCDGRHFGRFKKRIFISTLILSFCSFFLPTDFP